MHSNQKSKTGFLRNALLDFAKHIASSIYLRNINTITIKLHISLSRLTSISFYFRKSCHNIKLICNKLLLFASSTLKKEKKTEILFLGKFDPNLQGNFIEIALLHGCPPVNLLHNCRTLEHLNWYVSLNMEMYLGIPQHLIPSPLWH